MSLRNYPIKNPSSALATGRLLYNHLMENIKIAGRTSHDIWYSGEKAKLNYPQEYAFRGGVNHETELELISINGKPIDGNSSSLYNIKGLKEPILVKDLHPRERKRLGIPEIVRDEDKVFNPNFVPYEQLSDLAKYSNELAALSVPKSISAYFGGLEGRINYSEKDVLIFITNAFNNLSGKEMNHLLHANHMAWAALAYIRDGGIVNDVKTEFYGQNPTDFYMKDLGTILPMMFYTVAMLGQDPREFNKMLDTQIWGSMDVANYIYEKQQELFLKQEK